MPWKQYRSHKIVKAAPIIEINNDGVPLVAFDEVFIPNVPDMALKAKAGDYAIEYEDGYKSISPKAAFESGYTEIP